MHPAAGQSTGAIGVAYTDRGSGLAGGETYHYVVRALAGSPAVESASSNGKSATAIARPAAPSGQVTATPGAGGRIDVAWSAVSGAEGYNVYRRTAAGSFDFAAPLNGSTPIAAAAHADTTAVNGTTYRYVVRAVVIGAGSAQVESESSSESAEATSDAIPPPVPSSTAVASGGPVTSSTLCGFAAGTRFVNTAGRAAVSVTTTIATPEPDQSVVFSATTPGSSTPVTATVAATGTTVTTTLDMTGLLDGTVTVTARTRDAAGNLSATKSPANAIVKDTVAGALSGVAYVDQAILADQITGTSECGATIVAIETKPRAGTFQTGPLATALFTLTVDSAALTQYAYSVTATDLAGNASPPPR